MNEGERRAAEQLKRTMIEAIEEYFDLHLESRRSGADREQHRVNIAAAALLLETTRADHEISDDERVAVARAIRNTLGLTGAETSELIRFADQEVQQSVPLHEFTRLVEKRFSLEQKRQLVQSLWQVAFSDAELRAHEEYLVRKVAELINLSRADLVEAKIRAREAFR